jgi:chitodextrinase
VVLSTNGVDEVTVQWEGVAGAVRYLVHRDWQYMGWVSGTTFVDATAVQGQTYRYQVRAQDAAGVNSAPTPIQSITVAPAQPGLPPFGTPANVVLSTNGVDQVTAQWEPVAGVTRYLIHRDWQYLGWVPAGTTTFVDASVVAGQTYRYQVRAQDAAGVNSAPTPIQSVTVTAAGPDITPPGIPPDAAAALNGAADAVVVSWSPAVDDVAVTRYLIHRDWQYLGWVPAGTTTFTDDTVQPGTRYRYQVRAQDAANNNSAPTDLLIVDVP